MTSTPSSLILWTGSKHSGKTTAAGRLVQMVRARGYTVAGCLAPSIYADGLLVGFDIIDLRNERRMPFARRETHVPANGAFRFTGEGLEHGNRALDPAATANADLIVIDEFGPLELRGQGWRTATDRLVSSTHVVLLLVVREELVDKVRQLYGGLSTRTLAAAHRNSPGEVLAILANNRGSPAYEV